MGNGASRSKPTVNALTFAQALFELVAHADVEADVAAQSEIILDIAGDVVGVQVVGSPDVEGTARGKSEQQAGHRVAGSRAADVRVRALRECGCKPE